MNTQHTPGPWKFDGYGNDFEHMDILKDGWLICQIYNPTRDDETHANARLIAAAPELLEALIGCKGAISRLIDKYNPDDIEAEWISEANEAIRKATMY